MSFSSIFRIKQLESDIQTYAQKYYNDGSSPISDEEFDAMVDELRSLKPDSFVLKQTGWGYNVESDTTFGKKCYHKYGLVKGLDKCHNAKELGSEYFDKFTTIYASLKLDGISVVLYYHDGRLIQALTRGDGKQGIEITQKVIKIDPSLAVLKNDIEFTGAVRGEILMSHENFENFKELHPEAKNGRNSTAGLINNREVSEDLKYLDIIVYTVIGDESYSKYGVMAVVQNFNLAGIVAWLNKNFHNVAPYAMIQLNATNLLDRMEALRNDWYGEYPADGIVITRNVLFNISTGEVTYEAKAFKFPAESKITTVEDIEWSLTKTKYLVPKVKVAPVRLSGTNVTYATGYNAKFISDNKIGLGSQVEIRKSGEIIPQIIKVATHVNYKLPEICPCCNSLLNWEGVHLHCPNPYCGDINKQDLIVWLRYLTPVDGLGDKIKLKFIAEMFKPDATIEDVMEGKSIYNVKMSADSGHKKLIAQMFNKLYGYDDSKFDLSKALLALNIYRLGDVTSNKLAEHPEVVKDFLYDLPLSLSKIEEIVGQATANSLITNKDKFNRLHLIEDRIDWIVKSNQLHDKGKVAITGKLSVKRADFENELKNAGYTVGDISKDTKFLITDNPDSSSSKNIKADKLGVTKITESEFRSKYM